jgi:signal peptidase II
LRNPGVNTPLRTLSPAAFYLIAVASVLLDQAVKEWVRNTLPVQGSMPLWPGVFHLTHTQNPGMAFSLLEGKTGLLAAAAFAVVAVIIGTQWRLRARMPLLLGLALSLPLGGAIGNLIDRLRHGYVTDLFDFRLIHFPVFNVADSAISIGVVLLAWHTLRTPEEAPSPKTPILEGER